MSCRLEIQPDQQIQRQQVHLHASSSFSPVNGFNVTIFRTSHNACYASRFMLRSRLYLSAFHIFERFETLLEALGLSTSLLAAFDFLLCAWLGRWRRGVDELL